MTTTKKKTAVQKIDDKSEEKNGFISQEDLKLIVTAAERRNKTTIELQKVALEAKNAELEHQVVIQHVFLKYGLSLDDNIDDKTGEIVVKKAETEKTNE